MCQGDPIGGRYCNAIIGPPKIKENNQNMLLNVILIQMVQDCKTYFVNKITDTILKKYKIK